MLQFKIPTNPTVFIFCIMENITAPIFYFGSLIGCLIGAIIHLIAGGNLLRLIFCILFSWLGFWVGNYSANRIGFALFRYGPVDYGWAIGFALLLAIFGFWISGENKKDQDS